MATTGRNKTAAVGYVRVSGQGQVNGTGFDRQEETIRGFCKKAGMELERIYREAHTGTEANRPVFSQMIEDLLSNGCRTIIVEDASRLARDLSVQLQLLSYLTTKGVTLLNASTGQNVTESMQADPMFKAMIQMQGVFAELEKSMLVKKLKRSRNHVRKEKGRCEGRKPFGYQPEEAEIVKHIMKLYRKPREGKRLGFYQIATKLNEEGLKTRTGKPWHGSTVMQIIQREKAS